MITKLFKPSDLVYICGALKAEGGYSNPRVLTAAAIDADPLLLLSHTQFCVNPLSVTNANPNPEGSRRHSQNVAAYRNFLLESDSMTLQQQRSIIPVLAEVMPIRSIVYSGSKSFHFLISVSDELWCGKPGSPEAAALYKQYWKGLEQLATTTIQQALEAPPDVVFDQSTKDVVRLARLPNGVRTFSDDRPPTKQEIVYEGPLATADQIIALAAEVSMAKHGPVTTADPTMSVAAFERELRVKTSLQWLRKKLEEPEAWASSEGMYHELFKLALWACDSTGVPYNTLELYLQKKVYPAIIRTGYARNVSIGAFNAYKWKNLI